MRRRMAWGSVLACTAVFAAGCWLLYGFEAARGIGARDLAAREGYLARTQPEKLAQMRSTRNAGVGLMVVGGVMICPLFIDLVDIENQREPLMDEQTEVALAAGGGILMLVGWIMGVSYEFDVRSETRGGHAQLYVGPNGCALAYRF